jgi:squalene-hopene/tetraprenyl-beta-curcumene cyclase
MSRALSRFVTGIYVCAVLCVGCARSPSAPEIVANSSTSSKHSRAEQSLKRAVEYLLSKQGPDGGWHSEHYGLLRSGQALTPFVLHALLNVHESRVPVPAARLDAAFEFLRRRVNSDGALGFADPDVVEYPNYSTAYALQCLVQRGDAADQPLIERMRKYLVEQQYTPSRGFAEDSYVFGGWGFGDRREPGDPGHMDLAHTRRVLDALRALGVEEQSMFARSESFLRLLQRHPDETRPQPGTNPNEKTPEAQADYDGGFFFSPVVLVANKGRQNENSKHFRSYATATCDGVLALFAAGVPSDDKRVIAARDWLKRHPAWDAPAGIPADHPEPWAAALHFYHLAVRSEAYARLCMQGDWQGELFAVLLPQQHDDGSFANARSSLMKEDDPILSTTLAVIALIHGLE